MSIKLFFALFATLCCLSIAYSPPAYAYDPFGGNAGQKSGVCTAGNGVGVASSTACNPTTTSNPLLGPSGLFTKATRILAIIAGAAAIIVIIVAGLQYITSGGDSKNVSNAKNTILYALIGLAVIVAGQAIITFVLSKL